MTTHKEALTLALEALESCDKGDWSTGHVIYPSYDEDAVLKAITAIKEALAQPEQEPITKLFGTLPIYDEHEFRKGFIAGQRDAFNRLEEQPEQEPVAWSEFVGLACAKIKAADDAAADRDYMLDSDDCIKVLRGEWKAPLFNDQPTKPITTPQRKPLTDEMVLAGARALAKRHADSCGLDFDDVWKYYAEDHKADAKAAIEAAHGIKEKNP